VCTQALHHSEGDFMRELEVQMAEGEESDGARAAQHCMPMEEAGELQRAALQQAADFSGALSACEEQVSLGSFPSAISLSCICPPRERIPHGAARDCVCWLELC
jgi:hypothetical protein